MEIKIPGNGDIKNLVIKDFHSLIALDTIDDTQNPTIREVIMMNHLFTGVGTDYLSICDVQSNHELFRAILRMLDTYTPRPMPPARFEHDGVVYNFVEDLAKMPTGWFVDLDSVHHKYEIEPTEGPVSQYGLKVRAIETNRIQEEPELMAAFCYIEEGMEYAQTDKNKNILNPLATRAKIFREHFPLSGYLDLSTFFLRIYVKWTESSIQIDQRMKNLNHLKAKLANLRGRLSSMQ